MLISILSQNIWGIKGPYGKRVELLREWLRILNPDIIGFQETYQWTGEPQVAELLNQADYYIKFVPAISDIKKQLYGISIASKWPIMESKIIRLPNLEKVEPRIAFWSLLETPFGNIPFICTHLNNEEDHSMVRQSQIGCICDFISKNRRDMSFPSIIAGDFNADSNSPEIRSLMDQKNSINNGLGFHDAWSVINEEEPGYTLSRENEFARKSTTQNRRIDYIFVEYTKVAGNFRWIIESSKIVCNEGIDKVWPSDHFGILVKLRAETGNCFD